MDSPTFRNVSHAHCFHRSQVKCRLDTSGLPHAENLNTMPTSRRKKSEANLARYFSKSRHNLYQLLIVFKTGPIRTGAGGRISPQQREHKAPHCEPDQTSTATTEKTPNWLVSQGVPTPPTNVGLDLFSISSAGLAQKRGSTPPLKEPVRGAPRRCGFSVCWYEQHDTKPAAFRTRTTPTNAAGRVPRAKRGPAIPTQRAAIGVRRRRL